MCVGVKMLLNTEWLFGFCLKWIPSVLKPGAEMKIHKKVLNHYLSCTSPVDKEGYLYKMVGLCI